MKTNKKKEINMRTVQELEGLLKEARDALFSLKLEKVRNKLKNTKSISFKRKDIARILTLIKQKEIKK